MPSPQPAPRRQQRSAGELLGGALLLVVGAAGAIVAGVVGLDTPTMLASASFASRGVVLVLSSA